MRSSNLEPFSISIWCLFGNDTFAFYCVFVVTFCCCGQSERARYRNKFKKQEFEPLLTVRKNVSIETVCRFWHHVWMHVCMGYIIHTVTIHGLQHIFYTQCKHTESQLQVYTTHTNKHPHTHTHTQMNIHTCTLYMRAFNASTITIATFPPIYVCRVPFITLDYIVWYRCMEVSAKSNIFRLLLLLFNAIVRLRR